MRTTTMLLLGILGSSACATEEGPKPSAQASTKASTSAASTSAASSVPAKSSASAVTPASAAPSEPTAGNSDVDAGWELAKAMCDKGKDAKVDDMKTFDKIVAKLHHPVENEDAFKDGPNFPFVGTKAAVTEYFEGKQFTVFITADGSDPCDVSAGSARQTKDGNPVLYLMVYDTKPGTFLDPTHTKNAQEKAVIHYDHTLLNPKYASKTGLGQLHNMGASFVKVTRVDKTGAELDFHGCGYKGDFAIGHVNATMCPNAKGLK